MLSVQRWVIGTKVKEIAKDGYEKDWSLCNALIDMYAKCDSLMLSRLVLRIYKVKMGYLCMCPSKVRCSGCQYTDNRVCGIWSYFVDIPSMVCWYMVMLKILSTCWTRCEQRVGIVLYVVALFKNKLKYILFRKK